MSVLNCVFESVSQILRKNVEKKAVFENLVRIYSFTIVLRALDFEGGLQCFSKNCLTSFLMAPITFNILY